MSRDISQDLLTGLSADVVYPIIAIELEFDNNTLRLWSGLGTLTINNEEWFGVGTILGVSSVEETAEISARGAEVQLSAVPEEVVSLALQTPYQGRKGRIYLGQIKVPSELAQESGDTILQENGDTILVNTLGGLSELFSGYMDTMDIEDSGTTSVLMLSIENKLVDLERQRVARFTSQYQKSLYPDDLGLDFVESLQDKVTYWGRGEN